MMLSGPQGKPTQRLDMRTTIALTTMLLALCTVDSARGAADPAVEMTPLLAAVLAPPRAVPLSDGSRVMPYEIELTNVTDGLLTVDAVEIRDPQRGDAVVGSLSSADVAANLLLPAGKTSATLGPAQTGILLINLPLPGSHAPRTVEHWITATTTSEKGPSQIVEKVARVDVDASPPIVVGPPLRGERWVAEASCCTSYHRRAILPINGRRFLAQRFAIDWLQLDADNRPFTGDPSKVENYPQFGKEVVAVADATVTHVVDGLPEQTPGALPADVTLATADGNSVILDLGGNHYALYAHMQPGSIRVRTGEHVRRGQVLGLVGNSGNTSAPHLHFHVMDGPSALASNGLPYVIDNFEVTGEAVSHDDLDSQLKNGNQPVEIHATSGPPKRTRALPANLAVVTFSK
jgi:peptidase M23-like protein